MSTPSLRRLVVVLAVVGVVSGACGSRPLGGLDEQRGTRDACRSLDEVRRLGERYDDVVDDAVLDAVRTAEDDPDVERDEVAVEALRETLVELDPVAADLLDAYRAAAAAAPDVADDLEVLVAVTEDIVDAWQELLERPDADPGELIDALDTGDERELFEAWVAMERVKEYTSVECGFEFVREG